MPTKPKPATPPTPRALALKSQGREIQRARLARGMSQTQAALALGVPVDSLRQWEHGRRACPAELRGRIVAEWGGDGEALATIEGRCPCCGRAYA